MSQPNLRLVEGTSVDKTKALDAALSQIERSFGKGSIMRLGKHKALEVETVPTGSPSTPWRRQRPGSSAPRWRRWT